MNIEKPSFKKICLMHLQALTNFPYIEKDFDAITDYELLCKVVDYLNQVITNNNEQNTVVENLYNAFVELKDYVDNYFDNLDVQEEINNKLDEMAEDGTLDQIIEQYLNSSAIWGFDTVADMKSATNLIDGSYARTLGYHSKNDGGEAIYKIRNITNDDVVDEMFIIAMNNNNTLIAELIINNFLAPEQIGAYGDNTHDDTTKLQNAINSNYKIIGNKNYLIGQSLTIGSNKIVEFNGDITYSGNDSAIKIDGRVIKCKFNNITSTNGICLNIGGSLFTQGFDINFNSLNGNIPIKIGGNNTGTLDGTLKGQFITFINNAIKIDLSSSYVGQINFYNFRIQSNSATSNYAIDIDCTHNSCTGLSFTNISLEGNMNGLHAYNMTNSNTLETLYMDNIRCAEISYQYSKKVLCFETTGENDSINVRGYINFDATAISAFDFTNYRPDILNSFKGTGNIASNHYVYWREFYAGYKGISFRNTNRIQRTTWTPEENGISSTLLIVDKDGSRTNYHSSYKTSDVFYVLFEVNGRFTIQCTNDQTKHINIQGTAGDLFLVDIFPSSNNTGSAIVSKISNNNTLITY